MMFTQALTGSDLALLRKFPKADLHNHGLLGGRISTLEKFYGSRIEPFRYAGGGFIELDRWIKANYLPVLRKPGAFEAMVEAAFLQAKEDGVTILEMSIDAGFGHLRGIPPEKIIEVLRSTHLRIAPEIDYRPELGFTRPSSLREMFMYFDAYLGFDFFRSIDLYDDELSQDIKNFRGLYKVARQMGLKCKAHIGEFGNADSVKEAVEVLELDAVQHGIAAVSSTKVMQWLADNQVGLNICPTSNVVLERVPSLKAHPIRILYDNGVKVTVNTDDVILFDQGVSEEFLNLYNAGVMSAEELDAIRLNGLSS
jgi:adenosine deaminase